MRSAIISAALAVGVLASPLELHHQHEERGVVTEYSVVYETTYVTYTPGVSKAKPASTSTSHKTSTSTSISTKSSTSTKPSTSTKISTSTKSSTSIKTSTLTKTSTSTKTTSTSIKSSSSSTSKSSSSTHSTSSSSLASKPSSSTTSTSSTPTSSALPSPYARNDGKRGLPYGDEEYTLYYSHASDHSQVNWAYNYYSIPASDINPALAFIPMLWGDSDSLTSVFEANVKTSVAMYGTDAILGFNEPDECSSGQSCISVSEAVAVWKQYIQPLAGYEGIKLGAPAVTNGPGGLPWLSQFLGNCTDCTIDFVPIHWYAGPYSFQYLQSYVNESYYAALQGGVPGGEIWITEFGMDGSYGSGDGYYNDTLIQEFLMESISWLDTQSYVERYAWFGDYEATSTFSGLVNEDGTGLSPEGVLFNNYTAPYVCGGLGDPC